MSGYFEVTISVRDTQVRDSSITLLKSKTLILDVEAVAAICNGMTPGDIELVEADNVLNSFFSRDIKKEVK